MDYIDTSALLKGYVIEPATKEFMEWIAQEGEPFVSPLSVVEFRYAIRRRERTGQLTAARGRLILERLDGHLLDKSLGRLAWRDQAFPSACALIDRVDPVPLRALDALHLAIASHHRCRGFATADRFQAEAAQRLGFTVHTFFSKKSKSR